MVPRPDSVWIVDSFLSQASGLPIRLEWEVRDNGQGPRIADVKIEGVSIFLTRRSEFNSYILNNDGTVEPMPRFFLVFAGSHAHVTTLVRRFQLLRSLASRHPMRAGPSTGLLRLTKEGDSTGRLSSLANSLFGKGGNEDDRHIRTAYGQLVLQFQPTHSLHLHVRDQARGVMQLRRG